MHPIFCRTCGTALPETGAGGIFCSPECANKWKEEHSASKAGSDDVIATGDAAVEGAAMARLLLSQSKTLQVFCNVMTAGWRVYAAAHQSMQDYLARLQKEKGVIGVDQIGRVLAAAMRDFAAQPFSTETLETDVAQVVLPFLKLRNQQSADAADIQREKMLLEIEQVRRETPVPVGVSFDKELAAVIPRDRSVILCGAQPDVQNLLGRMVSHVISLPVQSGTFHALNVLWLANSSAAFQDDRLLVIPQQRWAGIAASRKKLSKFVNTQAHGRKIDLLVVGDLSMLMDATVREQHRAAYTDAAIAGHVRLRRCATDMGAALLAGVSPAFDAERPIDLAKHALMVFVETPTSAEKVTYGVRTDGINISLEQ